MKWIYNKDHPSYYYKIGDKIQHIGTQEMFTILGFEPCPFSTYYIPENNKPCYVDCSNDHAVLRIDSGGYCGTECYCVQVPNQGKKQWIIVERKGEKRYDKRREKRR